MKSFQQYRADWIVSVVCILTLCLLLGAAGNTGREKARQVACSANIKRSVDAAILLAEENNGYFKSYSMGSWPGDASTQYVTQLSDLGIEKKMLYCPSNSTMQQHMDQFFNFGAGYYSVLGYCYLNEVGKVRSLYIEEAGSTELVVDRTISQKGIGGVEYFNRVQGGMGVYGIYDQANHLKSSTEPYGGNIGFVDGHVAWRPFSDMEIRKSYPTFWW